VSDPVLRVDGLHKSFDGVRALDDVSFELYPREVVGLVGENGAGKSTLLNVIAGLLSGDSGQVLVRGHGLLSANISAARAAGVAIVSQEPALLPNITVAENILLGDEAQILRAGLYDWRKLSSIAAAQLAKLSVAIPPLTLTGQLSLRERRLVDIARALAIEERTRQEPIILFDEPTSALDPEGIEIVLGQIEQLRRRASILFVSHRLDEVLRVSDRILVMANGRCVAVRDRRKTDFAELTKLMLGSVLESSVRPLPPVSAQQSAVTLSVRGLVRRNSYLDVSFDLHVGEVLGIAELAGRGADALCRTLFGVFPADSGEIVVHGRRIQLKEPSDAVQLGIGYVPPDRQSEGIVGELGIRENMMLAQCGEIRWGPLIDFGRERKVVKSWIERLRIKTPTADTPAHNLSGGNQQKVVLAKWMIGRKLKILILDRPFRGLDIGATAETMNLVQELARSGLSILLVADTVEELTELSHSIIVMKDGLVADRFSASTVKRPRLQVLERMV